MRWIESKMRREQCYWALCSFLDAHPLRKLKIFNRCLEDIRPHLSKRALKHSSKSLQKACIISECISAVKSLDVTLAMIAEVTHSDQVPEVLQRVGVAYGLKTIAYLGTGTLDRTFPRREPYVAATYSSEWVERYRSRSYLKIDPAIQIGLRRLLPIDWGEFGSEDRSLGQFFGEASEFGLGKRGMSFPVHGHTGDRALLSVTADFSDREWQWARRTAFRHFPIIATHIHDAVLRTDGLVRAQPHLSPRELECLQWTSHGKTVWECGMILKLSQHTVRCYLESARHKLGASSNTHAVSLALKSGLLFELP